MPDTTGQTPAVSARTTTYTVTCVPESIPEGWLWAVTVEHAGNGRWAVRHRVRCLASRGEWDWEPIPSERDDDWLGYHRFDLPTALRLAREVAPGITVNGISAAELAAQHAEEVSS